MVSVTGYLNSTRMVFPVFEERADVVYHMLQRKLKRTSSNGDDSVDVVSGRVRRLNEGGNSRLWDAICRRRKYFLRLVKRVEREGKDASPGDKNSVLRER